jgi:peptide-methionine (S)-S-oxide reductase
LDGLCGSNFVGCTCPTVTYIYQVRGGGLSAYNFKGVDIVTYSKRLLQVPIATEIEEMKNYWPAELYHQEYLANGGRFDNPQSNRKGCTDPIRCYG